MLIADRRKNSDTFFLAIFRAFVICYLIRYQLCVFVAAALIGGTRAPPIRMNSHITMEAVNLQTKSVACGAATPEEFVR